MAKEIWKPVVGYEGMYEVSNKGRVRSLERKVPYKAHGKDLIRTQYSRMLALCNKDGYKQVSLWKDGKEKRWRVHRLVAFAFIPNPENKPFINHLDETRDNNCVENLEWCTAAENLAYGTARERGRQTQIRGWAEGKYHTKISDRSRRFGKYTKDGELLETFMSTRAAERSLGKSSSNIWKCLNGYALTAYGYKWEYIGDE